VVRALIAILLFLLMPQIGQAKKPGPGLSQSAVIFKEVFEEQQTRFNDAIDAIEKTCLPGHEYKFTVDSTNNLKIAKNGDSKSLTIDRSNALSTDNFFDDADVRSLVDNNVRECMKNQWKNVLFVTDTFPLILPSRMFAGPGQYPPTEFKAYGVVAFNSLSTDADKDRYSMICNAYVSSLLSFKNVKAPLEKQMVTVWPVDKKDIALKVSAEPPGKVCADAVPHYGLSIGQEAILAARRSASDLTGKGPFLLAWSPGATEGQRDVLVLTSDMSDVINNEQAKQIFERWASDIAENPALWDNGWDEAKLKQIVRLWADKWGTKALEILGGKS
jgi:hypothetical protein